MDTKPFPGARAARDLFLRTLERAARKLSTAQGYLVEVPVALFHPALERACTDRFYERTDYRNEAFQKRGLLPFEERALARFFPKPPARLLVHGAGAAREVVPLVDRGYEVTAFEPSQAMLEDGNRLLAERGLGLRLRRASVQEWSEQASRTEHRFDAVFTGWAMWTHVMTQRERIAVLRAFREVCPTGPILLSFWRSEKVLDAFEVAPAPRPLNPALGKRRLHRATRYWLRQRLLGLPPLERGTGWSNGMYFHLVDEHELREEASMAGYTVLYYERDGSRYPHGILVPGAGPTGQAAPRTEPEGSET
jgi:hypothetical protein